MSLLVVRCQRRNTWRKGGRRRRELVGELRKSCVLRVVVATQGGGDLVVELDVGFDLRSCGRPPEQRCTERGEVLRAAPAHGPAEHVGEELLNPPVAGPAAGEAYLRRPCGGQCLEPSAGEEPHRLHSGAQQRCTVCPEGE